MRPSLVLLTLLLLCILPAPALAATPDIEQLHRMLLDQQEQIQAQNAQIEAQNAQIEQQIALLEAQNGLLSSLEQDLADQRMLVMSQQRKLLAQEERSMEQQQVVAHLKQKAVDAQTELDLVQAMMTSGATNGGAAQNGPNPYLDQAGPMTASLDPAGAVDQEPELPFTITAGVEHLKAYSDSFTYLQSEGAAKDEGSAGRNYDTGYKIALDYTTRSGITWGADYHYWAESQHSETAYTRDSVIVLGPIGIDANNVEGTVDAERYYGDLYLRGMLAGSSDWRLDLLGGLRGGSFSQNISVYNLNDPSDWAESSTSYLGFGPMAGLDLDWALVDRLGLAAHIDAAALLGQSKSDSQSREAGAVWHRTNSNPLDVVWMVTSRLGLDYTLPLEEWELALELGLNTEYWTGLPDHIRYQDDVDSTGFYQDTDVLLVGPYFDLSVNF